MSVTAGVT